MTRIDKRQPYVEWHARKDRADLSPAARTALKSARSYALTLSRRFRVNETLRAPCAALSAPARIAHA